MEAIVIYESLTGNTKQAADAIAAELNSLNIHATVCKVGAIDFQALSEAGLVVIGSWVDGMLFIGQKPGRSNTIKKLPRLDGKKAAVFCTYAIDPGTTLVKLEDIVSDLGADVLGGVAIKRNQIASTSKALATQLAEQFENANDG